MASLVLIVTILSIRELSCFGEQARSKASGRTSLLVCIFDGYQAMFANNACYDSHMSQPHQILSKEDAQKYNQVLEDEQEFKKQFNGSCTIDSPCDLSNNNVWENNIAPSNNDDVVIDFSDQQNNKNIYLTIQNSFVTLNSFSIVGQQPSNNELLTNLLIQNLNFTVLNQFYSQDSKISFYEDDPNYADQSQFGTFIANQTQLNVDGFSNITSKNVNFIGTYSSTFSSDALFTVQNSTILNAPTQWDNNINTNISNIVFAGTTYIEKEFTSQGTILFRGNLYINDVYIGQTLISIGNVYISANVKASIVSTSSVLSRSTIYILKPSVTLQAIEVKTYGTLTLNAPGLTIESNFTMNSLTNIQINSATLNNTTPFINLLSGQFDLFLVTLKLQLNSNNTPTKYDSIFLFNSNRRISDFGITKTTITTSNNRQITGIEYDVEQDTETGNVNVVFNDPPKKNTTSSKDKIIVGCVVGGAVLIIVLFVIIYISIKKDINCNLTC
ncbi:hypothetical protein DICPUDRAFT_75098 [Dictyostelium purpureum]|uniref:Transmembrane protein n=1 Tax=Dictyostelium purpureum TaxID=5786 RepID=F0Z9M9_DICPU|nr:uncharacterized protein DICPUDRAFT_75098 [Dictyostelium purpureum]EGC39328.1 hypothetical protein DICPUDRAFT_75098 [Dictyostelium purpureum]|eukprot:XP_003284116.1 hypothetical protein DICPUDRAFT_75098 [Dictyostelium purpureum]